MRARIVIQPHGTKHIVPNWRSIRRPKKTGGAMRLAHILRNCRQVQDTTAKRFSGAGQAVGLVWILAEAPDGNVWIAETSPETVRPITGGPPLAGRQF